MPVAAERTKALLPEMVGGLLGFRLNNLFTLLALACLWAYKINLELQIHSY